MCYAMLMWYVGTMCCTRRRQGTQHQSQARVLLSSKTGCVRHGRLSSYYIRTYICSVVRFSVFVGNNECPDKCPRNAHHQFGSPSYVLPNAALTVHAVTYKHIVQGNIVSEASAMLQFGGLRMAFRRRSMLCHQQTLESHIPNFLQQKSISTHRYSQPSLTCLLGADAHEHNADAHVHNARHNTYTPGALCAPPYISCHCLLTLCTIPPPWRMASLHSIDRLRWDIRYTGTEIFCLS